MMIYEIEKLNGCIATEEQMLEIMSNKDIVFDEPANKKSSPK